MIMRLVVAFLFLLPFASFSQNKHYDKLEMLYDQGHYKKVLRSSEKLLRKTEHQDAILPHYYKSIAQLQLLRNEKWRKRNSEAIQDATKLFQEVKKRDKDGKIFKAHSYEIQSLKKDYDYFLESLEQDKKQNAKLIETIRGIYTIIFADFEFIEEKTEKFKNPPLVSNISDLRKNIVQFAFKHQGIKYKSGGNDPNGFDCSGFVNFVFNEYKMELPRISRDQQKMSTPLKAMDTQPGDLVFFASGNGVNHVGIVVENKNGFITMIHSSSSQGIVVTEIDTSNYWKNRIHSYGTFFKE